MPKSEFSESESEQDVSSEEETHTKNKTKKQEKLSDYEEQRLKRIEENKKRMEALGLHQIATSFMGSVSKTQKIYDEKKGKKKIDDEDEEYNPNQDDEEMSSSSEDDENDEDFSVKKVKKNMSTSKKCGRIQKPTFDSDFVDDDDALMQAIALSLQDSGSFLDIKTSPPQSSSAHLQKTASSKTPSKDIIRENAYIQNDSGKRKRKKPINSRVQMTEDEMLVHFFQFDETGKGGFTVRDIERLATTHDFVWSEKEMADMIYCFDGDGDGKISLDDFCKIVGRLNMLKGSDDG